MRGALRLHVGHGDEVGVALDHVAPGARAAFVGQAARGAVWRGFVSLGMI